jgi:hypothetical protein
MLRASVIDRDNSPRTAHPERFARASVQSRDGRRSGGPMSVDSTARIRVRGPPLAGSAWIWAMIWRISRSVTVRRISLRSPR